jgi:hypothetical protein
MPLDVLVPDLLLPAGAPPALRGVRLPALERWLARADVEKLPVFSSRAWLAQRFGLDTRAGAAAIALAGDDRPRAWSRDEPAGIAWSRDEPAGIESPWLRADPVHFLVDRDRATLHDTAVLRVTRAEADALVAALQAHFESDGLAFAAPVPERWYVRVPPAEMPATTPLDEAVGRDIVGLLPRGAGRINWPGAFTEAQMVLGAHPVNVARESRGEPAINSVWFWGEGTLPACVEQRYKRIHSNDAYARGLATLSNAALAPGAASIAAVEGPESDDILATVESASLAWRRGDAAAWTQAARDLDAAWFAGLGDAIKRFGRVRVVLPSAGGARVASLTPASRWRWFRGRAPLAHA